MADIQVEYVDHMGDDLLVANSARVSFDKRSTELSPKDEGLIRFLARGCDNGKWEDYIHELGSADYEDIDHIIRELRRMPTHWAPFAHPQIILRETVPICVARQRFKHKIGFVESEVSRRYVTTEPEFYTPPVWRKAADNKKQGSSDESVDFYWYDDHVASQGLSNVDYYYVQALTIYEAALAEGICPEQARMFLPQSMMTTYQVTGSLYAFAQLYNTRTYDGAQVETADLAHKIGAIIEPLFPVSWRALTA